MNLYLLFPILILGNVECQTANVTEEEFSKVVGNQTFSSESTANNSTMKPGNVTSSLYRNEKSLTEKLQINQTFSFITEDDENFQEQENKFPKRHCLEGILVQYSHNICGSIFHTEMMSISTENWCVLENILRPYNDMTVCLEELSAMVNCYYPNPNIQEFFLYIHSRYFHNCSKEELPLVDAPHGLVVALTLIPVSLIPILVYLVVWKSSVQE